MGIPKAVVQYLIPGPRSVSPWLVVYHLRQGVTSTISRPLRFYGNHIHLHFHRMYNFSQDRALSCSYIYNLILLWYHMIIDRYKISIFVLNILEGNTSANAQINMYIQLTWFYVIYFHIHNCLLAVKIFCHLVWLPFSPGTAGEVWRIRDHM